jgi:hypothetical protein
LTKLALVVFSFFITIFSYGQETDLARLEYTYIPQVNSENSINRLRTFVNLPLKLGWEGGYLIPGFEYRNLDMDINDAVPFEKNGMGRFQTFRVSLAAVFKVRNNWIMAIRTGSEIASNFEESTIGNDDINFSGAVYFIKDRTGNEFKRPNRLTVGVNYSTNAGRPFPIPIFNYYRKFQPDWSYSLGTPKSNLKYFMHEKHIIQLYATLDGFFSNIQRNRTITYPNDSTAIAENISMTMVLGGLGYEYYISKHLLFYLYGGWSFYNEIRLRDADLNNIYVLNDENTFYLRSGIKFKI